MPAALRSRRCRFVNDERHGVNISWRLQFIGGELVLGPDHEVGGLPGLEGFNEDIVIVPFDLHGIASRCDPSNLFRQCKDADVIQRGMNLGNAVGIDGLVNDGLSKGHAPAQNAEYDDTFLNEHDGSLPGSCGKRRPSGHPLHPGCFTPQWCESRIPASAVEAGSLGLRTS